MNLGVEFSYESKEYTKANSSDMVYIGNYVDSVEKGFEYMIDLFDQMLEMDIACGHKISDVRIYKRSATYTCKYAFGGSVEIFGSLIYW